MITRRIPAAAVLAVLGVCALNAHGVGMRELVELESFLAPGNVAQMQYSAATGRLFLNNGGGVIRILDTSTRGQVSWRVANSVFSDMDFTPDGQYLYAADYGGEVTGYGTPMETSYVHRYNLASGTWESAAAPGIAYRIAAVSSSRVLLLSSDQWVDLTLNAWGPTLTELSKKDWGMYFGDIAYDAAHARVLHASGYSLHDITTFGVSGDTLVTQETSTSDRPYSAGDPAVLSTDGRNFYYGQTQYNPLDVRTAGLSFPASIYAASADLAFGRTDYYDALTGTRLGSLGFSTKIYALDAAGRELWAFDPATDYLHHYAVVPEPTAIGLIVLGAVAMCAGRSRKRR